MSEAMPKRRVLERRQALLVALCSREAVESRDFLISECITDPDSTREFLDLAISHRVVGLTLVALERNGGLPEGNSECQMLLQRLRRRAMIYQAKRDHIVHSLEAAGVRPIVLKGAALATTFYAEMLLARNGPCDLDRAGTLLDESLALSTEPGMKPLMEREQSRLETLGA